MSTESTTAGWARPVVLAASCLVIGFVGGWALRGGEKEPIVLPPATAAQTPPPAPPPPPAAGGTDTTATTGTETTPTTSTDGGTSTGSTSTPDTVTDPVPPAPPALPDRAQVRVSVLNGSGVAGAAGTQADRAEGFGYTDVQAANAPTQSGPTIIYFREGAEAAARRLAADLGIGAAQVTAAPADTTLLAEASADAQVIMVIGQG